ncbi:TonB-dependent hemoglobin/transferrin/lactoferrin family receptor [Cupriavidus sp. AU9028]|uniref:TonB-dependent hemoglobin/transferrin/lactoferrin family receptor n=1 Tax=Cupriavidus sp. AU9028 TaxID=2871157 RepID=UPI001C942B51|nr:TonB-dependent hemoglobin/transferrin/lactoferrin family receptor [Cupriavidus sp. AU9028]MBY4897126.1 TonB-dependent hemoglobin/transferrin/lactoferrin family receptor [Cupriavidus sp. AU9028]
MARSIRLRATAIGAFAATVGGPCLAQSAHGADPAGASTSSELPAVVVSAARRPASALTTPATVSVIERSQMQETVASDFRELFRYEPGIAVKREPRGRGGEAGIEVRGIGGQRLAMFVDGVRLPGGHAAAGANLGQLKLDPLALSRVEVLRGPASSLYGSDALAGVVLFRTLSPDDFLDADTSLGGSASLGYDGADNGRWANANVAFRAGATRNLIGVTARNGHELENHDDSALHPNPQDTQQRNLLVKSVLDIGAAHTVTLTGEHYEQSISTDQRSLLGPIAGGSRINGSRADDDSVRDRLGLAYRYAPSGAWFDRFSVQADYQRSTSKERTWENRKPPGASPVLLRDSLLSYREPQWSGSAQLDGSLRTGSLTHRWITGLDVVSKSVSVYNDGLQRTASGGASNVIDGEVYPRRIAPDTDVRNIGVFVQDEIAFGDGRLRITPGLRYDYFKLSPNPDPLFANANVAGSTPVALSEGAWTPRLGVTWEWRPRQVLFANYVTGFRMPTYDQLNRIGQVPVATFIHDFIPAPNLKPEKSRGIEVGMRGATSAGSYALSAFYNRYTDFISTEMIAFIPPGASGGPRGIRRFQSRNIGEVEIYGIEAQGQLLLNNWIDATDRWRLFGALQWSMGNDKSNDQPLNTIQPARLATGLRWDKQGGQFGGQLIGNFVAAKTRVNQLLAQTGPTAPVPLTTSSYATMDLTAYWRIGKQATLNLAVYNVLDREYYDWASVSQLSGNDARLSAYTAPGRTVAVSMRMDF